MTTGKTIALTMWTFVGKVMSLLFNMLSRFILAVFSKDQVSFNLGTKKIKSVTGSNFSPCICHEVMEPDAMILVFLNV